MVEAATASAFRGPHIAYLRGRVRCPLAGIGARAADASNRLVVDDPATQVTIDGGAIAMHDDRACPARTPIADLVWLAEAAGADGRPAPFTIHLEVWKTGHTWKIDLHTHEPTPLAHRASAVYEPFTIAAVDRGRREVLVDPAGLARAVGRVPIARRLSSTLVATRDHLAGGVPDGRCVFDRSIGIGALGRGMFLVRARLAALEAAREMPPGMPPGTPLATRLAAGAWELALEALTERWLPELVARDLFLFGIADVPLLAELRAGRLRRGQTLAFRTTGEVRLDDRVAPLPDALDLARAYLELHMLGGIIAAALR